MHTDHSPGPETAIGRGRWIVLTDVSLGLLMATIDHGTLGGPSPVEFETLHDEALTRELEPTK